ncbi:unnamed protein product [Lampetra fluviatilis]
MTTPEKGNEAPSAEQRVDHQRDSSQTSGRERHTAHSCFAELPQAAASMVDPEEPAVEERATEPRRTEHPVAVSRQWGTTVAQPAQAATILLEERSKEPAKSETALSSPVDIPSLRRRLPFVKEFTAAGGDWVAFKRRFLMNSDLAGWTQVEVLGALPAALDDNTSAAFLTIQPSERATLHHAFAQMAAIYEPPSNRELPGRGRAARAGDVAASSRAVAMETTVVVMVMTTPSQTTA